MAATHFESVAKIDESRRIAKPAEMLAGERAKLGQSAPQPERSRGCFKLCPLGPAVHPVRFGVCEHTVVHPCSLEVGSDQVDRDRPTRIVDVPDRDAIGVLPVSGALVAIPLLKESEGVFLVHDKGLPSLRSSVSNPVTLIHERFNLLSLGGAWASRKLGIPFVLEVNADLLEQRKFKGVPERGLRRLFAVWATQMCFNAAAEIICISAGLKEHLSRKWKIEDKKLTVLACAADVNDLGPNHNPERIRQGLGLTTEPVIMWVGGFFPWHDLDLLIASFALVVQRHPGTKLVLVGEGQTRASVAQKVQKIGLEQSVIMTGAIPHSDVPGMLSIADIAVVPAAPVLASGGGTGTPLKLFEYMAAAKPIVATDLNQAADVIRDGHSGLLVAAGNVNMFADAIVKLINDPLERARLGKNAQQQATDLYSWEGYTRSLEKIYHQVLHNDSSVPHADARV